MWEYNGDVLKLCREQENSDFNFVNTLNKSSLNEHFEISDQLGYLTHVKFTLKTDLGR